MLKNHWTSLKTFEKVVFSIRRMQKVGQNDRGSEIGGDPLREGLKKEILTVRPKCVCAYYNSV